jgi:hypothetical protein
LARRRIKRTTAIISRCEEIRLLVAIAGIVTLVVLGPTVLVVATSKPDLTDLVAIAESPDKAWKLVDWPRLRATKPIEVTGEGANVQIMGYVLDGVTHAHDGEPVREFLLSAEAGHALHPAHRDPENTVDVVLDAVHPFRFRFRELVWVTGRLHPAGARLGDAVSRYIVEDATVTAARPEEIKRYFQL